MARQEDCAKCKWAKHGAYADELKCSYYGRKPQFDDNVCPNLSDRDAVKCPECGHEVSPEVDTCPNCGYPLKEKEPPKKTAADIINEHKQNEADLREKIIKKYNIEGDISEEQYIQLVAIYMEEEGKNNTAPSQASQAQQSEKSKKPEKETSSKKGWIIFIIVVLLGGGVAGYIVWNKQDRAARQEAEADYNRMLQEQRMEQERELERQLAEQERIKREASQINGVWAHQDIDPTFYERYTETLEFRGDQYKYRRESNSRSYGFDWCHYTREGNKIYVDGKAIMTIEQNGNIVFSDRTYVKVR